jgi:hypothetical protein
MILLSRRGLLVLAGAGVGLAVRLEAANSDFWNKKPPADWTPEEIDRLLKKSPWAKEITPTYTSLPPATERRVWSENPPVGLPPRRDREVSIKAPYQVTIRWESADPIRTAENSALPAAFGGYHVLGIFVHDTGGRGRAGDLGSKPVENLKESAVLLGTRAVDAEIVQVHQGIKDGFLVGFPKTFTRGDKQLEFSARVGLLALKAKFHTREMLYHGQLAL